LDIHHVFPKKWCVDHQIDHLRRESIVNKTAISAETNRKIGGQAPSKYIPKVLRDAETTLEVLHERLAQHHVDLNRLIGDDFDGFFDARRAALLQLIGDAMGKLVAEPATPSLPGDYDLDDEELLDEDVSEFAD